MPGNRGVDRENANGLAPARLLHRFEHDASTFGYRVESVTFQDGDMEQDIRPAGLGNHEAVAFRDVEPLDVSGDLDGDLGRPLTGAVEPHDAVE